MLLDYLRFTVTKATTALQQHRVNGLLVVNPSRYSLFAAEAMTLGVENWETMRLHSSELVT